MNPKTGELEFRTGTVRMAKGYKALRRAVLWAYDSHLFDTTVAVNMIDDTGLNNHRIPDGAIIATIAEGTSTWTVTVQMQAWTLQRSNGASKYALVFKRA